MIGPAPRVAALRRFLFLYMPALVLAAAVFLVNYPLVNGGTIFGMLGLVGVMMIAACDLEKST